MAMTMITTNRSVELGVPSTFSWSRNPNTYLPSFYLWTTAYYLNELHGGTLFLLEDSIQTKSTMNVGDDMDAGETMVFFAVG